MYNVIIYTDGSSRGNPGPGGFGTVLVSGKHRKEISQGYRKTTNNRMELLAVIVGLTSLKRKGLKILVVSDSKYVVDSVTKRWVYGWQKKGFKDKKNPDLWKAYLEAEKGQDVSFKWIKGHAGHEENERCDFLAVQAATSGGLLVDKEYEKAN